METMSPRPIHGGSDHSWANERARLLAGTAIPLLGLGAAALMISGLSPGARGSAWRLYLVTAFGGAVAIGVVVLIKRIQQGRFITTDPAFVRRERRRNAAVARVTIPIAMVAGVGLPALLRGTGPLAVGVVGVLSGLAAAVMLLGWLVGLRLKASGWFERGSSTDGTSASAP